jgi:hypothetical protein
MEQGSIGLGMCDLRTAHLMLRGMSGLLSFGIVRMCGLRAVSLREFLLLGILTIITKSWLLMIIRGTGQNGARERTKSY